MRITTLDANNSSGRIYNSKCESQQWMRITALENGIWEIIAVTRGLLSFRTQRLFMSATTGLHTKNETSRKTLESLSILVFTNYGD